MKDQIYFGVILKDRYKSLFLLPCLSAEVDYKIDTFVVFAHQGEYRSHLIAENPVLLFCILQQFWQWCSTHLLQTQFPFSLLLSR